MHEPCWNAHLPVWWGGFVGNCLFLDITIVLEFVQIGHDQQQIFFTGKNLDRGTFIPEIMHLVKILGCFVIKYFLNEANVKLYIYIKGIV